MSVIPETPRASGGLGPRGSALDPLGTVCGPHTPRLLTAPLTTNPGSAPGYVMVSNWYSISNTLLSNYLNISCHVSPQYNKRIKRSRDMESVIRVLAGMTTSPLLIEVPLSSQKSASSHTHARTHTHTHTHIYIRDKVTLRLLKLLF